MMPASVGADAVTVPFKTQPPKPVGLARARLEDVLLGPDATGTALVVAPPGAGKTTLLGRVAATSGAAAWYTAAVEDHAESALVRYLTRALLGEDAPPLPPDAGIDALLAALGDGPATGGQLLVIDDVHEIAGTAAEDALERFLLLRPGSVRVLLGARRPPSFNTTRMLASGDLVELSGDDLRFRSWEVEDLFRNVYGEPLSPETAALLCRRVGGLAAALQLFHLSVRSLTHVEREAEVVRLNGRSRLIRSYLTRTVLDGLTTERRQFLLRTSPLGILDGALCDALLDRADSGLVLRGLESDQMFTTSPDEGLTYRYHQVLRDHLEVVLEDELPVTEVTALHAGAARLLERAGHHSEALRAYKRAGDWGAAARLVRERVGVADPDVGALSTGDLRPAEQNDPWLAVARIRRLLRQGSIDDALLSLRLVEAAADDPDLADYCAHERLKASAWLGNRATTVDVASTPLGAVRALTRTLQPAGLPVDEDREWGLVSTVGHLLAGRLVEARLELDRVYPTFMEGTWPRLAAGMLGTLLEVGTPLQRGQCCATLENLSLAADVEGYPWLARVAQGLQACLVLETAGQSWRIDACRSAISACQRDGDAWGELLVRALTSVALARQGEHAEARLHLDHAAATAVALDAPVLELWVRALTLAVTAAAEDAPALPLDRTVTGLARQVGLEDVTALLAMCRVAVHRNTAHPVATGTMRSGQQWVKCLGGFRLHHGTDIDLQPLRPRARLVLMLLAMEHGTDVHRERLIDSLWPGAQLATGTHRLQVAVSSIRRLLEDHGVPATAVQRHGDAYRLELPGARLDVHLLEEGIAALVRATRDADPVPMADRAAELLQLYQGDLLPEVGAADWVVDERDRLRHGVASALASSAAACLDQGRPDLGLWQARRVVQLDPLRDTAWLVLARIQQQLGDHSAAQVTLAEHARVRDLVNVRVLDPTAMSPPRTSARPAAARARA
ncbi:hypothetical protein MWU75_12965 [Ornithinimicrobium sp. F0845]|uniref:BTAD domain-containing putative transcriptional regulator n=1 Tax=Ornithinimicrobium sp. F0845 TaxID=2926412 RepID=UPI001FF61587|nr:BTAD domain-containing putative transcriptional regulator [Ornithinimicrobium sp. F0845]MCK0113054.1 hypothetical protein [Ornithinimicrobium sp. F0845]